MGADKRSNSPFSKGENPAIALANRSPAKRRLPLALLRDPCPALSCAGPPAARSLAQREQAAPQDKQTATSVPSFS